MVGVWYPYGDSQPSVTPVPADAAFSMTTEGTRHKCGTYLYMQTDYSDIHNLKI